MQRIEEEVFFPYNLGTIDTLIYLNNASIYKYIA